MLPLLSNILAVILPRGGFAPRNGLCHSAALSSARTRTRARALPA